MNYSPWLPLIAMFGVAVLFAGFSAVLDFFQYQRFRKIQKAEAKAEEEAKAKAKAERAKGQTVVIRAA